MAYDRGEPCAANGFQAAHAALILASHRRLTGRDLLPPGGSPAEDAQRLYRAPFVVLAHDIAADPLFFYANLAAQRRFELGWEEMVRLPSRRSAEPLAQAERAALLARVARDGYIDDYAGIRIAGSGRRFRILAATVWNLVAGDGARVGQAAAFERWEELA